MDTATPPPPEPIVINKRPLRVTMGTVLAHVATLTIATLATAYYNRPTVPATAPVAPLVATTPPAPVTPPPPAPVAAQAAITDQPTVLKVDTLRIEAGTVQLVGNIRVAIPEIKPPNVIVENKLPQAVMDALVKPQQAPVVNVHMDNPAPNNPPPPHIIPTLLPDIKDDTTQGELLPPPRDAKPVRVLPTINEKP